MNATCKSLSVALLAAVAVVASAEETSQKVKQYERITGVIHRVPSNGVGLWMVGSRTFEADSFTSFNTFEASMTAGNCAVVLLRQSRAVQIVLLRQGDC
jgi:hypothetical protein